MSLARSSVIEPAGAADACVIFLHGQGSSGYGFEPLIHALALPPGSQVRFVLPGAPIRPLDCRGGEAAAAWYDASVGETVGSIAAAQIDAAVAEVQALIGEALEAGIDAGRIIVGGFGQGADIAARAALAYRKGLGGLMLLSPELSCPLGECHSANRYLQITLHHGRRDRLMAEASVRRYADRLGRLGYNVDYTAHDMGNQFCAEELKHLRAWLIARLVRTRLVA
ncbi:alpha/beta hydrolase [Kushneria aurantia]|uniref:Alpha/beta hydrolase n=1 Tax=Kushneria aurantia TaxID=504092 RepID=A0ABV6G3M1_9GAMM|nr:alpha/beta hydrolase fold domain-containing protein [Kushneria aurantia]